MQPKLIRTDSSNEDFISLVRLLDADLAERDGTEHAFYAQFNKTAALQHVIVAYLGDEAVACGALRPLATATMEVKRMYTLPAARGRNMATAVLTGLEQWAVELGYIYCMLETGIRQPEAIALYRKNGYAPIPNYGQYVGIENSVCFKKTVKHG